MARIAHIEDSPLFRSNTGPNAKLSLLEALLEEQEARHCATLTLEWLARHAGVGRALCALADSDSSRLTGLAGNGLSIVEVETFNLELTERAHPLSVALAGTEPVFFDSSDLASRWQLETPLGTSFLAIPLTRRSDPGEFGPGLLLVAGEAPEDGDGSAGTPGTPGAPEIDDLPMED
ncbi:MAG TPA: hypothetical protein VHN15_11920, partial [Thermoanaerobaculia bacterium]|nr:hypothetical protein [Thermoanaerobaculia bacterium]